LVSHIYFGNWSFLQLRYWIYHFFRYLTLIALAGFLIYLYQRLRKKDTSESVVSDESPILILACFYLTFCLGLAHHVLITFAAGLGSSTTGWYIYCLVIAEIVLVAAGAGAVLPKIAHGWILPFLAACFAMLDLYATHFVLIPYYTGLIAHKPNGALAVNRLLCIKPAFWHVSVLLSAWLFFLSATIGAVVLSIRMRPRSQG
jgi:hypothetical protein